MKLSEAVKILSDAGIVSAAHDARTLFETVGGMKAYQLVSGDAECEAEGLPAALKRRAMREPLQYIIGEVDFYREHYKVTPDCLIPREDTEILVDYAVKNLPRGAVFFDLCTGSGCVAVSVLKNTKDTRAYAYDISEAAISVARENAAKNGVSGRIEFRALDLMRESPDVARAYAVLSNPPYVSNTAYEGLEGEIFHEPKCAFVGGEDGGDFYRKFIPEYKKVIDKEGFLAFEIGFDQKGLMEELARENGMSLKILKDLSGNDRTAIFTF